MIPLSVYLFLLVELIAVSYLDILYKKISNYWPIMNIAFFLAFLIFMSDTYKVNFETFFYSIAFLGVGFFLYMIRVMGAGDSKFLFSFYIMVPSSFHESAFICLIYSVFLIGGGFFVKNIFVNRQKIYNDVMTKNVVGIKMVFGKKFAFAPVILVSWIWFGIKNKDFLF